MEGVKYCISKVMEELDTLQWYTIRMVWLMTSVLHPSVVRQIENLMPVLLKGMVSKHINERMGEVLGGIENLL